MALLSALAAGPSYPRLLAKRLGRSETHVAHRLRTLERGALVEGNWSRKDGKNVRLYHLKLHRLELVIEERGWQIGVLDDVSETPHSSRSPIPARCSFYRLKAELQSPSEPLPPFPLGARLAGIATTS